MKHHPLITSILLLTFLAAQFIGLAIVYKYIDQTQSAEQGKTIFKPLPIGERPPVEEKTSYIPVLLAILLGTGLLLLLIRFHLDWVWKAWFLIAVVVSLTVALAAFIPALPAFLISLAAAAWKILKPNVWIQNFTELFIYGGLAAIFVPLFNLRSISILLVLIAIYDAYAVWKSKHMVTLAKSQAKSRIFAGLLIPYKMGKLLKPAKPPGREVERVPVKVRTAILGGGDIGFPLIFAGVVLKQLGLWQSLVIPFFALAGLALLLLIADEKKFYPAMPFISAGCLVGLAVVWLAGLVI
ncbi:MAG: presenilin family intramembrane aspartyl protease [Nanoarchaeota archaeon]